ncbi:MAG TPA: hypothetical protein VH143_31865 [Kofleriaceae bacterium]|jgi:hypothetical protein|nr:hypothetical protein [Kofleriaceae bacterium]
MRTALLLAAVAACKATDPAPITAAFTDLFERPELGELYFASGSGYGVHAGAVSAHGAHNHPLWLRRRLPENFRIELDCWSTEARGDIKVEIDGDGHSFDPDGGRYTATGYEVVFGGWYNSKSIIARLDEHGKDVVERTQPKVNPNQRYHWKIERRGDKLTWWIDDMATPFLVYDDPQPLTGDDHGFFAFNNWETDTWFDNLVITPL